MNENEKNKKLSDSHKKSFRLRYIISAVILLLLIAAMVFILRMQESKPDPTSEKIIRGAAAAQLKKDPNDLTEEDFAKIEVIDFGNTSICDISLLNTFVNLRVLILSTNNVVVKTPVWKKFLAKYGIIKITTFRSRLGQWGTALGLVDEEIHLIDLSALKKLYHLQDIMLMGTQVENIEPLAELTNLKKLNLHLTGISDIKPLRGLKSLEELCLDSNPIRDLESLKNLKNLRSLSINHCDNISKEQIKDLQKTLPNLYIYKK